MSDFFRNREKAVSLVNIRKKERIRDAVIIKLTIPCCVNPSIL